MSTVVEKWRKSSKLNISLGLKGTIVSITKVNSSSDSLVCPNQFYVVLAKMENKTNLLLQLVSESTNPRIGDKVVIVLRRVRVPSKTEIIEYGYKFKKID
jgi:uncharacterized OB-fold protein